MRTRLGLRLVANIVRATSQNSTCLGVARGCMVENNGVMRGSMRES